MFVVQEFERVLKNILISFITCFSSYHSSFHLVNHERTIVIYPI